MKLIALLSLAAIVQALPTTHTNKEARLAFLQGGPTDKEWCPNNLANNCHRSKCSTHPDCMCTPAATSANDVPYKACYSWCKKEHLQGGSNPRCKCAACTCASSVANDHTPGCMGWCQEKHQNDPSSPDFRCKCSTCDFSNTKLMQAHPK